MTATAAVLLLIGLWTPIAGALIAVAELGLAVLHPAEPCLFEAFIAAAQTGDFASLEGTLCGCHIAM